MTLTKHGHHIPGSPSNDEQTHPMVHRCGGPSLCEVCGPEASRYWHPTNQKERTKAETIDETNMTRSLEMLASDIQRAEDAGVAVSPAELRELRVRIDRIRNGEDQCGTCSGPVRQTVDMKCLDCGTDYS